jgi:hypothetical protein
MMNSRQDYNLYCETPIPKAQRSGMGKLNPDFIGTQQRV